MEEDKQDKREPSNKTETFRNIVFVAVLAGLVFFGLWTCVVVSE
jgi:hypothetical protein